ncbi:MAG: energy transducer TonB [Paracoccaceae bacterium]
MQIGYAISSSAHAVLIGFVLFGGVFRSEPEPFEITEVSVISSADFDALTSAPQAETEVALPPALEPIDDPDVTETPDVSPAQDTPPQASAPDQEDVPETPTLQPDAEVQDDAPPSITPPEDVVAALPEVSDRPKPKPVDHVAPEAVETPTPEAKPDVVQQDSVTPDDVTNETPEVEQEETAPEEAASEIVTEAEEPASSVMTSSVRPPSRRPSPPKEVAETKPAPQEDKPDAPAKDDVNDALQQALGGASEDIPVGPPLSAGEKDGLRVAVQNCWNVGSLSTDALRTTVVVAVSMAKDAKPVGSSVRMLSYDGGSAAAAKQAFEAARRAILRCGAKGFDLPVEKYGQWKEIEMTFNPERMRIR